MAYSVNLLLSAEAEAVLADLQSKMKEAGVPGWTAQAGHRPHIELCQFISVDASALKTDLKRFATQNPPFDVTLGRLELSGTEVIINMEPNPALSALHNSMHLMMKKYGKSPRPEYAPGVWAGKMSLAVGVTPDNLDRIKPILGGISLPWTVPVEGIGVFLVNPNRIGVQAEVKLGSGQLKDRTY